MPNGGELTFSAESVHLDAAFAKMKPEAKEGWHLLLQVADTGSGIAPEIAEKIFDPFFTTKDQGKGTGLGLSTVMGIVKSHGGFIMLKSEVGRGSTFEIYLPALQESTAPQPIAAPPPATRGNQQLVLVVDDEASIRHVLRQALERYNYQVLTANDGAEAAVVFARQGGKVNLVITDLDMPFLDGVTLIRVLKQMAPQMRFVVSSGLADATGLRDRGVALEELGVQTILRKPYTAQKILAAVEAELQRT
jgi:CheY-like chemotaxis protein